MPTMVPLVMLLAFFPAIVTGSKPHIVYALVDDWGHYNSHVLGNNPDIHTPNLDKLVANGAILDRHYTYQFCSPTRVSLMSGRLPIHVKEDNDWVGGVPRNMTIIAKKLQSAGYSTHHLGKWHAGSASFGHIPAGRGFDTSLGYFHASEDHYANTAPALLLKNCSAFNTTWPCGTDGRFDQLKGVDLWRNLKPATGENGTGYNLFHWMHEVTSIITTLPEGSPLFLYMAFQNNHAPLQVPDQYSNLYNNITGIKRTYYGMTTAWDDALGNITRLMESTNMWSNTLLVISSDNGGPIYSGGGANNYPLRGGKISDFEGGVRVASVIAGGFLPSKQVGKTISGYIHICDWYATFCAVAGVNPVDTAAAAAGLPPIDSMNMWPMLSGENSTSPRVSIPLSSGQGTHAGEILTKGSKGALIHQNYKIIVGRICENAWTSPNYPNGTHVDPRQICMDCGTGCLFDIINDPTEHHDLSANPAYRDTMLMMIEMHKKLVVNGCWNHTQAKGEQFDSEKVAQAMQEKYNHFWGPAYP
eukprot:m.61122 g.61122  ORF g.61122 m.61122 type:complete len:529 (+) comp11379_c0_seq2:104-1690(+)